MGIRCLPRFLTKCVPFRLEDVEAKLADTEKEADKARQDSRTARDTYNDVKRRRYSLLDHSLGSWPQICLAQMRIVQQGV